MNLKTHERQLYKIMHVFEKKKALKIPNVPQIMRKKFYDDLKVIIKIFVITFSHDVVSYRKFFIIKNLNKIIIELKFKAILKFVQF